MSARSDCTSGEGGAGKFGSEAYWARLRGDVGPPRREKLGRRIPVQMSESEVDAIDEWRKEQAALGWGEFSRGESIRQLIWWGRVVQRESTRAAPSGPAA
jgi:hypothetical protein